MMNASCCWFPFEESRFDINLVEWFPWIDIWNRYIFLKASRHLGGLGADFLSTTFSYRPNFVSCPTSATSWYTSYSFHFCTLELIRGQEATATHNSWTITWLLYSWGRLNFHSVQRVFIIHYHPSHQHVTNFPSEHLSSCSKNLFPLSGYGYLYCAIWFFFGSTTFSLSV